MGLEVCVREEPVLQLDSFFTNLHPLRIVNHLVAQLQLRKSWALDATIRTGNGIIHKVLLYGHVDHITVFDAKIVQFGRVVAKQLLTEEQLNIGLARCGDQAL